MKVILFLATKNKTELYPVTGEFAESTFVIDRKKKTVEWFQHDLLLRRRCWALIDTWTSQFSGLEIPDSKWRSFVKAWQTRPSFNFVLTSEQMKIFEECFEHDRRRT